VPPQEHDADREAGDGDGELLGPLGKSAGEEEVADAHDADVENGNDRIRSAVATLARLSSSVAAVSRASTYATNGSPPAWPIGVT